jgi:hypothetical protein
MQRSDLAQKIAAEKCLTFRGETICSEELSHMVADMLKDDVLDSASATHFQATSEDTTVQSPDSVTPESSSEVPSPSSEDECCGGANPYVPENIAPIVLVLNIFMPGIGTYIAAYYDPAGCNCKTITCGIFQQLTLCILVGWIWSVCQGVAIYRKSLEWAESNGQPAI